MHTNLSPNMASNTFAKVVYRSNSHLDQQEHGFKVASLMLRTLNQEIITVQAIERQPMPISISCQSTNQMPASNLCAHAREVMTWPKILSASVAMGFYYAVVEEMGASFLAMANNDISLTTEAAKRMATRAWERRRTFTGSLMQPAEAVHRSSYPSRAPFVLMDIGVNGRRKCRRRHHAPARSNAADSIKCPGSPLRRRHVYKCVLVEVCSQLTMQVGAKTDQLHGTSF